MYSTVEGFRVWVLVLRVGNEAIFSIAILYGLYSFSRV